MRGFVFVLDIIFFFERMIFYWGNNLFYLGVVYMCVFNNIYLELVESCYLFLKWVMININERNENLGDFFKVL